MILVTSQPECDFCVDKRRGCGRKVYFKSRRCHQKKALRGWRLSFVWNNLFFENTSYLLYHGKCAMACREQTPLCWLFYSFRHLNSFFYFLSFYLPTVVRCSACRHSHIGSCIYAFRCLLTPPSGSSNWTAFPSHHIICLCAPISCLLKIFLINTTHSLSLKFFCWTSKQVEQVKGWMFVVEMEDSLSFNIIYCLVWKVTQVEKLKQNVLMVLFFIRTNLTEI